MAPALTPEQQHEIVEVIKAGRKIEAIKMHREATGLGLKESRDAVEALTNRKETPMAPALTPEQQHEIVEVIKAGRKIEAIKMHREVSGLGLKESKDAVEALTKTLAAENPEQYGALVTAGKSGCASVIVVGLVLGLCVIVGQQVLG